MVDATFLADHLADADDPIAARVCAILESLEELYAVALDRGWTELPAQEAELAYAAVVNIAQVLEADGGDEQSENE